MTFRAEPQRTEPSSVSKHTSSSITPKELLELHFAIDYEDSQFTLFKKNTFETAMRNIDVDFNSPDAKPLLMHLHKTMPHWTPSHSDSVVYATVDEAHSGTFEQVGDYLSKLKTDLKIGQEGYPSYVIVGGDQQIYAHMKNLKIKYSERYEWVYPVPGDWHIMKTAAEALRGIILNGGFSIFGKKCGHKGDINQL